MDHQSSTKAQIVPHSLDNLPQGLQFAAYRPGENGTIDYSVDVTNIINGLIDHVNQLTQDVDHLRDRDKSLTRVIGDVGNLRHTVMKVENNLLDTLRDVSNISSHENLPPTS